MAMRLFNTLSGREEELQPLEPGHVRMYACGPTVYDYAHIGNFRTFVFMDVLRRFLRQSGYKLTHVMNVTDVDDKIIQNAANRGVTVAQYTQKYEHAFFEDMQTLNLERPEIVVRATDHIADMAAFIRELERKGFAYRTEDGSYYFRIARFPEYGKLSKKDFAGIENGARVDVDRYEKDNARDFALWKSPKPGEASWDTAIGPGRPGWHIECSVMAMKYLGESFDIHLGGEDLIFPHHENEIAQSEAKTGKPFAHIWLHARFLLVEGEKMSKSLGNFFTLRDLVLKGHRPSALRYLLASVPYRKQLNFTFDGLKQAAHSVERLRTFKERLERERWPEGSNAAMHGLARQTIEKMRAGLEDDLNTAQALAAIFDLVREANAAADRGELKQQDAPELLAALGKFDEIFAVLTDDDAEKIRRVEEWARAEGLLRETAPAVEALTDAQVEALVAHRQNARRMRDFAKADALRKQLADAGIILEDTKDGVRWKRK
ncbi:MAG TPA: cysteine--tRNA ligase [Terriglobales bacterium]|nr:cysteine--tRNA ligase [Terriglobales bacterium]